jgi:DNA-binding response OmpR family regulator
MKILIIEDDKEIVRFIKTGLEARSYAVDAAFDGERGSFLARTESYDLIILDYNLPKGKGDQVITEIRADGKSVPILVLSIQAELDCKQKMYELGADDYLTKPFLFEELIWKIRAIWRRPPLIRKEKTKIGNLEIDEGSQIAKRGGKMLRLTRKEFALLSYLAQNQSRIVSRSQILENVWDINADPFSNTIEAHMANLRKKLNQRQQNNIIHTFPGQGYKLSLKRFSS